MGTGSDGRAGEGQVARLYWAISIMAAPSPGRRYDPMPSRTNSSSARSAYSGVRDLAVAIGHSVDTHEWRLGHAGGALFIRGHRAPSASALESMRNALLGFHSWRDGLLRVGHTLTDTGSGVVGDSVWVKLTGR